MTSEFKLSPSILSADFSNLQQALDQCRDGGAPGYMLMLWTINLYPTTIGPPVVKSLRSKTEKILDIHDGC